MIAARYRRAFGKKLGSTEGVRTSLLGRILQTEGGSDDWLLKAIP